MLNQPGKKYDFIPLIYFLSIFILLLSPLVKDKAVAATLTGRDIMVMVDEAPDGDDRTSTIEMVLINRRNKKRVRMMSSFGKDYGKDTKKLMGFKKPMDIKGTSFLSWEYDDPSRDDDKWLYMPALRKVRRISGASTNDYFMGSDFTYDDMGDRNVDEDDHTLIGEEAVNGHDCWKIKSIPREDDSLYDEKIIWVRKDAHKTIKAEYYDAQGLIKTYTVEDLREYQGFWTVFKMKMENHREQHTTLMTLSNLEYNTGVDDGFFSVNTISRGHLR
nr:outer membrane lipoprotein-sorting protein [uncultured Desulfobacter sp.]